MAELRGVKITLGLFLEKMIKQNNNILVQYLGIIVLIANQTVF